MPDHGPNCSVTLDQIAREADALANAPLVPLHSGQNVPRCHFCGQITTELTLVEGIGDPGAVVERYAGRCCRG